MNDDMNNNNNNINGDNNSLLQEWHVKRQWKQKQHHGWQERRSPENYVVNQENYKSTRQERQ